MEAGFQLALDSAPFLLKGAYYTVILSLGGMFFGLLLGFGLALMRLSRFKLVSWIARVYVSFFRGRMARRRVCARVMPILAAASHWPRSMELMAARRISQA